MSISPRSELRILSLAQFHENEDRVWSFSREDQHGNVLQHGEGFEDPYDAIAEFFSQIEYDPAVVDVDETLAHWSRPFRVHPIPGPDDFVLREYAYGAPQPYQLKSDG